MTVWEVEFQKFEKIVADCGLSGGGIINRIYGTDSQHVNLNYQICSIIVTGVVPLIDGKILMFPVRYPSQRKG